MVLDMGAEIGGLAYSIVGFLEWLANVTVTVDR